MDSDSAASAKEMKLHNTMVELDTALKNLAAHDLAFRAPQEPFDFYYDDLGKKIGGILPATPAAIAAAQKASREASPRWIAEQKIAGSGTRHQLINYRNYEIHYYQKPAPGFGDWSFSHRDFDGAPDGPNTGCSDHRCGYAETPTEAKAEIDAQYEDLGLDADGHYK